MKTIAQFAKEVGTTPTTVYRKLDQAAKQDVKACLTVKQGNISYLTQDGEEFLYSCLTPVQQKAANVQQALNTDEQAEKSNNEQILFLREQVKSLQKELNTEREHSREQSKEFLTLAGKVSELAKNSQILLRAEQERTTPSLSDGGNESPQKRGKRGLFGLFKR